MLVVPLVVLLLAAPAALAQDAAGAGIHFNTGTSVERVTFANDGTTAVNQIDVTLPPGTNGSPAGGGVCTNTECPVPGMQCTPSSPQAAFCRFNPAVEPGQSGEMDFTTGGAAPTTTIVTFHFTGGGTQNLTAGPCGTIGSSPSALPHAAVGRSYSQQLTGSGGATPYTFAYQGALPGGILLSPAGLLSGTPGALQDGTFSFQLAVTDGDGCVGSPSESITVDKHNGSKHYDLIVTIVPRPPIVAYDVVAEKASIRELKWLVTVQNSPSADEPSPATTMTVLRSSSRDGIDSFDPGRYLCNFSGGQTSQAFHCRVPALAPGAKHEYLLTGGLNVRFPHTNSEGPRVSVPCGAPEESEDQPCPNNSAAGSVPVGYAPEAQWGKKGYVEYNDQIIKDLLGVASSAELAHKTLDRIASGAAAVPLGDGVAKVEVAVLKVSRHLTSCQWLNRRGTFTTVRPRHRRCADAIWLPATGTSNWSYPIAKGLPTGNYLGYVRAISKSGATDLTFTAKRGNRVPITVRHR